MNRLEFMTELAALLRDISAEEREEALQYYSDYFEDAGIDRENDVLRELGSPKRVADMIRAGLEGQNEENSEYRETGYSDTRFESYDHPATREVEKNTFENAYHYTEGYRTEEKNRPWTNRWLKIILIVLIIGIGAPIVIPLVIGILAVIFGIIVTVAAVIASVLIAGIAVALSGLIVLFAGAAKLFVSLPAAFAYAGIGFLMIALGTVMTVLTWWLALKLIPPVFRWIVSICKRIINRSRKEGQV